MGRARVFCYRATNATYLPHFTFFFGINYDQRFPTQTLRVYFETKMGKISCKIDVFKIFPQSTNSLPLKVPKLINLDLHEKRARFCWNDEKCSISSSFYIFLDQISSNVSKTKLEGGLFNKNWQKSRVKFDFPKFSETKKWSKCRQFSPQIQWF